MLGYIRDRIATLSLKARHERLIQENLFSLTENRRAIEEDSQSWERVGASTKFSPEIDLTHLRDRARKAVRENPHACNVLRLLEAYVTGPGLKLTHQPVILTEELPPGSEALASIADYLWNSFLARNAKHYSFSEHARRTWRDGECFLRRFTDEQGEITVRFVDPERVQATSDQIASNGIETSPSDIETPLCYHVLQSQQSFSAIPVPAAEIIHTRHGVDSNEPRGVSFFAPILDGLERYEKWMETELLARKLQTSIVLWRKVQGGNQFADQHTSQSADSRKERFSPGSILTTNHGTDIQFLQPNTNFGDAVPLGRLMLLSIAAGAGLPEFMLTADASNGNFASTMIAEGPAVKFFQGEQLFFSGQVNQVWRWVMQHAIDQGILPINFFDRMHVSWSFPALVNRDRSHDRLADVKLIESGVLSRAEVGRRDGVQPEVMRAERAKEEHGQRISTDHSSNA